MASFAETGPRTPVTEGICVDKVHPRARLFKNIRAVVVLALALVGLVPIFAMGITAFKSRADVDSVPHKLIFGHTLEGFVFLLTLRSQLSRAALQRAQEN